MDSFASRVLYDWTLAVADGAARLADLHGEVYEAMESTEPRARAAAVAVFSEADCADAHDRVMELLGDDSSMVRGEAVEYLGEFALPGDAARLFERLEARDHVFLVTQALRRIATGGPILDDDDPQAELESGIEQWRSLLKIGGPHA